MQSVFKHDLIIANISSRVPPLSFFILSNSNASNVSSSAGDCATVSGGVPLFYTHVVVGVVTVVNYC